MEEDLCFASWSRTAWSIALLFENTSLC